MKAKRGTAPTGGPRAGPDGFTIITKAMLNGWGYVSRDEFAAALRADGILGFSSRSTEAGNRKRWQDRQRQRLNRAE